VSDAKGATVGEAPPNNPMKLLVACGTRSLSAIRYAL